MFIDQRHRSPEVTSENSWSVWRSDDNGVQYEIYRNLSIEGARERLEEFEALRHKQFYWISRTEEILQNPQ